MHALEIESDVVTALHHLLLKGDLRREDVVFGDAAKKPSYKFSLACRYFGLRRDVFIEDAFEYFIELPDARRLSLLLKACGVPCECVADVVEVYAPDRAVVVLRVVEAGGTTMVYVGNSVGYDSEYLLTPESMAALVHTALRQL